MQHISKEKRKTNLKYFIILNKVLKIMFINHAYKSLRFDHPSLWSVMK